MVHNKLNDNVMQRPICGFRRWAAVFVEAARLRAPRVRR